MTKELFRQDGYLTECEAVVTEVGEQGIVVDQTVFYPIGGGQPGDSGRLTKADGSSVDIVDTRKDRNNGLIYHLTADAESLPEVGESVKMEIDWSRRHRMMRVHSCLHMLCALVPAPVTGGSIRDDGSGRLDFDLPDPPDKQSLEEALRDMIAADHPMTISWISDGQMQARPELVRTMSVTPPMGTGSVRLIQFGDVDLQPCGGTHIASSGEIGEVRIKKIEKKGKINRRITVELL